MSWVTQDQISRAREVDILDYVLTYEHSNVRRVGSSYRLKDHPSLSINSGVWYWHSRGFGGRTALDYLTDVRGYGLVEAVCTLIHEQPMERADKLYNKPPSRKITPRALSPPAPPERKPFKLPLHNADNSRIIEYLQSRGIDMPLILACIENRTLYESTRYHNCVFVGRDDKGKARFAALRGTTSDFKCDVEGSEKRFGFTLPPSNPKSDAVAVFESPIDCLSHQTLCNQGLIEPFDGWRLSLGGTALVALNDFLERHSGITNCVVCTDNDEAGNEAAAKITEINGIAMTRSPPTQGKDWNETLKSIRNEVKYLDSEFSLRENAPSERRTLHPVPDKRKDIRFITSDYKTLFTVKDGDSIKFTNGYDGEVQTLKCRHIDEAHLTLIGKYHNDYHICELTEIMERNGSKCEAIPGQKPKLNIIAAKYGEPLRDTEIPMTDAAIKKLVGGKYSVSEIQNNCVLLRGKEGVAVCKSEGGVLTTVHPYWAQTLKRELGVIEPPQAQDSPVKKPSLLGKLEVTKEKVAEQKSANALADSPRKNIAVEMG